MLKSAGSQTFMKRLRKDMVDLENKVAETHRRVVKHVTIDLITFTPQWSGNAASNWYITFTGMPAAYSELPEYQPPYLWSPTDYEPSQMGADPVVQDTIRRELLKLPKIRWNTKVTIVNKTPYAEDMENNIGPMGEFDDAPRDFREVNLHPNYGRVAMVAYVETKYKNLRTLKRLAT